MTTILVMRDGQAKMRLVNPDIRADGTVWHRGQPVLDGQTAGVDLAALKRALKARDWAAIPAAAYARMGTSPSGLTLIEESEHRRALEAALTPAQRERRSIRDLFAQAENARHATDDDQMDRHFRLLGEAKSRLAAWRTTYPADAREEDRAELIAQAEHQEHLAVGAQTYDADGWLDATERDRRAAEFRARAAELRAQAASL